MGNNIYNNTEYEAVNEEESLGQHNSGGKKKSGRVVIRNINFINSKSQTSSDSDSSDTDISDHKEERKRNLRSAKRKVNRKDETLNGQKTDGGHWDAFQTYLLKSAAEGEREDVLSMEKDHKAKRREKTKAGYDQLLAHAPHNDDTSGRHRSDDAFMMAGRREVAYGNGFEEANLGKQYGDDAVMLSTSGVNDCSGSKMFDLEEKKSNKPAHVVKYEPDALSLMPERDVENIGYDPAIDYEMQLAASNSTSKQDMKGSAEKRQSLSKPKPKEGVVRKGRPSISKVNKNTLDDARARADKLRSYKADLQKMKKQQVLLISLYVIFYLVNPIHHCVFSFLAARCGTKKT